MTIYRLEFKASGMIRPGPTALWAGGGQLLIPSDPTIAPIGQLGHMVRIGALTGGVWSAVIAQAVRLPGRVWQQSGSLDCQRRSSPWARPKVT